MACTFLLCLICILYVKTGYHWKGALTILYRTYCMYQNKTLWDKAFVRVYVVQLLHQLRDVHLLHSILYILRMYRRCTTGYYHRMQNSLTTYKLWCLPRLYGVILHTLIYDQTSPAQYPTWYLLFLDNDVTRNRVRVNAYRKDVVIKFFHVYTATIYVIL